MPEKGRRTRAKITEDRRRSGGARERRERSRELRFSIASRRGTVGTAARGDAGAPAVVQIDVTSLSRVFSAPMWLRDLGLPAWFLVGVALLLVGLTWLLGITSTITIPVVLGAILATVTGPLVTKMQRRRIPRPAGAAIVLLGLLAITVVIGLMVFGGHLRAVVRDQGRRVPRRSTRSRAGSTTPEGGDVEHADERRLDTRRPARRCCRGSSNGIAGLTSLVFFLTFSASARSSC